MLVRKLLGCRVTVSEKTEKWAGGAFEKMVYQDNLAAVLHGPHDLRMEIVPIETAQAGAETEVQVNIRATGICGSDLHYYHEGGVGSLRMTQGKPMILGHESAGVVTEVGEGVQGLQVGDRVAIEPGKECKSCVYCKAGRYNLCKNMKFCGSLRQGPNHGTLRRYACFPARLCHKIPDNIGYEDGALIEPLAVAVHAVSIRCRPPAGATVAVLGAGPVGLLTAATAFAEGAEDCVMMDINPSRLAFAQQYLPKLKTIQLPLKPKEEDLFMWSEKLAHDLALGEDAIAVVYECTGVESCMNLAVFLARKGGRVMLIGMGNGRTLMPTDVITTREVDILGNFRYANSYPRAIALVEQGRVRLDGLVTHKFSLEDTLRAFETAQQANEGVMKVEIGDF
ncbi:sorbitol dehydrogenase [Dichotomocladium elegans]|nr:sorbitol dehydrogenase [Dichotomocladium elegans]